MVAVAPSSSQRGAVCVGVDAIDNAVDDAEPSRSASSATGWVARLQEAHSRGKLAQELIKLRRYSLLVVDLCRARDYAEVTDAACETRAGDVWFLDDVDLGVSA